MAEKVINMEKKYEIYKECGSLCQPNNGWTKG